MASCLRSHPLTSMHVPSIMSRLPQDPVMPIMSMSDHCWDLYLAPHSSSTCSQESSELLLSQELFSADPSHDFQPQLVQKHPVSNGLCICSIHMSPCHCHTRLTMLSSYYPMQILQVGPYSSVHTGKDGSVRPT